MFAYVGRNQNLKDLKVGELSIICRPSQLAKGLERRRREYALSYVPGGFEGGGVYGVRVRVLRCLTTTARYSAPFTLWGLGVVVRSL